MHESNTVAASTPPVIDSSESLPGLAADGGNIAGGAAAALPPSEAGAAVSSAEVGTLLINANLPVPSTTEADGEPADKTAGGTSSGMVALGDRMKAYEEKWEQRVPKENGFLLRVDGLGFSKFTNILKKPFDARFSGAMDAAMCDTMTKFVARSAYTHSDEATFVFPPCTPEQGQHPYNGRVNKMCSLVASYFSVRFNYHMMRLMVADMRKKAMAKRKAEVTAAAEEAAVRQSAYGFFTGIFVALTTLISSMFLWHTTPRRCAGAISQQQKEEVSSLSVTIGPAIDPVLERVMSYQQCFDARVLVMSSEEMANHMVWRRRDSERNSIAGYARMHFGHKQIEGKHGGMLREMLLEKGLDWDTDVIARNKWGAWAKRHQYLMNPLSDVKRYEAASSDSAIVAPLAVDNKKKKKEKGKVSASTTRTTEKTWPILRTRVIARQSSRVKCTQSFVDWLQDKYQPGQLSCFGGDGFCTVLDADAALKKLSQEGMLVWAEDEEEDGTLSTAASPTEVSVTDDDDGKHEDTEAESELELETDVPLVAVNSSDDVVTDANKAETETENAGVASTEGSTSDDVTTTDVVESNEEVQEEAPTAGASLGSGSNDTNTNALGGYNSEDFDMPYLMNRA